MEEREKGIPELYHLIRRIDLIQAEFYAKQTHCNLYSLFFLILGFIPFMSFFYFPFSLGNIIFLNLISMSHFSSRML